MAVKRENFVVEKIRTFSDFEAFIASLGSQELTLIIPMLIYITDDYIIPGNIHISIWHEGGFNISSGKTLTINGEPDHLPFRRWKYGSGSLAFGNGAVEKVLPEWSDDTIVDHTVVLSGDRRSLSFELSISGGELILQKYVSGALDSTLTLMGNL